MRLKAGVNTDRKNLDPFRSFRSKSFFQISRGHKNPERYSGVRREGVLFLQGRKCNIFQKKM